MSTRILVIAVTLALMTGTGPRVTMAAGGVGVDAGAAFDRLKSLAGDWTSESTTERETLSYEVVAGGATLLERETGGGRPSMLTLYHRDGARLLLTHYCMAGNQPRMEARAFDAAAGDLTFEFLDATNLADPGAGHMHSVAFHFIDNDHMETTWQFVENGKTKMTEKARYARVR
jgi:hypothetical protein